jgi:hypothetical protein
MWAATASGPYVTSKAIKGFLVWQDQRFEKIHNL